MNVVFDTLNIYYLPQYLPVHKVLKARGHSCKFVFYKSKDDQGKVTKLVSKFGLDIQWVADENKALNLYLTSKPDWIIFGNTFIGLEDIHKNSKTVQLGHGIGPKPSYYYKSVTPMTVRFIEGEARVSKIREMFPEGNFEQVGFSKLDPFFNGDSIEIPWNDWEMDPNRKTILYAPTFKPSSLERFPNNWPKDFQDFNVLIKPHTFTYTRDQYRGQRAKLKKWGKLDNCYVAKPSEVNLIPFMAAADIMLSEASSTLFEFVALDRPVVVCDFFHIKWSYRGPLKFRQKQRFEINNILYKDIGTHASSYAEVRDAIFDQLENPQEYSSKRDQYRRDHVGPCDGKVSERIADYLEDFPS